MPLSWPGAAEALLLAAALSVDVFVACFAYGADRIRIPLSSLLVVDGLCTGLLGVSLLAGTLLRPWVPSWLAKAAGFGILAVLGIAKLFDGCIKAVLRRRAARHRGLSREWRFSLCSLQVILNIYADPRQADQDRSKTLSPGEAAPLAAAMSLDGLAVGLGAGLTRASGWLVLLFSLILGAAAVAGGSALGNRVAARLKFDLSWVSGVLLLFLAFTKL